MRGEVISVLSLERRSVKCPNYTIYHAYKREIMNGEVPKLYDL